jgi:NADH-quinone oxidoreductase subunit L
VLFGVAFFTALLTAFYMARLLALAFLGTYRGALTTETDVHVHVHGQTETDEHEHEHGGGHGHGHGSGHGSGIHESPWVMLGPLVVLAIASVVAGYVDLPAFLNPAFRVPMEEEHHAAWLPWAAGIGANLASLAGLALYTKGEGARAPLVRVLRPLARLAEKGYGVDQAYTWFARRGVVGGGDALLRGVDVSLIDRAVNGTGALVEMASRGVRGWQSGLVRGYALLILGGAVSLLGYLLWLR